MAYKYSDVTREQEPHALPDVEIFHMHERDATCAGTSECVEWYQGPGYYYAFGFPGCLWDGDPYGPYASQEDALHAAREDAGEDAGEAQ
jgi:hypothetical protein